MPEARRFAHPVPPPGLTGDALEEWLDAHGVDPDDADEFFDHLVEPKKDAPKKVATAKLKAPLRISFELPFASAQKAAEARYAVLPSKYYGELTAETRRLAWTVSKLSTLEQMTGVLDSLNKAMGEGKGLKEWREAWLKDPANGALPRHYLNLVFRNHAQTAYMAGHWRAFEEFKKARPFLMYSAINDSRVRPAHSAMSGYIAPVDDAVWKKWTPPAGHNCRCSLISLNYVEAKKRGYGSETNKYPSVEPDPGFGGQSVAPAEAIKKTVENKLKQVAAKSATAAKVAQQVVNPIKPPPMSNDEWSQYVLKFVPSQYVGSVRAKLAHIQSGHGGFTPDWKKLTVEEMAATRYYMGPYAEGVNRRIRTGKMEFQDKQLVAAMQSMLSKLEPYKGGQTLRRGISVNLHELERYAKDHAEGRVIQWEAFTSMSTGAGFSGNVTFKIRKNRVGVRVVPLADNYKHEEEVLGPLGMQVRVTKLTRYSGVDGKLRKLEIECEDVTGTGVKPDYKFGAGKEHESVTLFRKLNDGLSPSEWFARESWVFAEACAALGIAV